MQLTRLKKERPTHSAERRGVYLKRVSFWALPKVPVQSTEEGEQYSNAQLTVQNARIENQLQVVGTVLCNIEIAQYMFTFTRMHLAISVSQSCNQWRSLIEGLSNDTCI